MTTIAFRNATSVTGSGNAPTITEPTGTAQGDILVCLYVADSGAAPTLPTGWTTLYSGTSPADIFEHAVGYVVRGSSAPNLTCSQNGPATRELYCLGFSGCATDFPIDAYSTGVDGNNSKSPNPDAVTAASANTMALAFGVGWGGATTGGWTAPTGYVIQSANATLTKGAVATKSLSSTGSEDPSAFTNGNTNSDTWAATITLAVLSAVTAADIQWITAP